MRYLLKMIFNVAVGEDDTEGNPSAHEDPNEVRKQRHDEAFAEHSESVAFIKDRVAAEYWPAVASEWHAIPQDDQMALWLATTKGGCFSTHERKCIKEKAPRPNTQTGEQA